MPDAIVEFQSVGCGTMRGMRTESRHLSVSIDRPAAEVYAWVRDPAHLPLWAAGLASGIRRERGEWVADSPMGRVLVRFVPVNEYGVLDHDVVLPDGTTTTNPVRVLADGAGSEVVFTLRQAAGATAEEFDDDTAAVAADLETLKRVLEAG
ncbi:SRPBCC family protein [Modestobacter caceresii]|nr:SRPBCC family protein [Modestobacter caceresii]